MKPSWSERKRMPNSAGFVSPTDGSAGVAVSANTEHGHATGRPVENVHVSVAASAFPAASVTPPVPPLTEAVKVVPSARPAFAVSDAVFVVSSYATAAGTTAPAASRTTNDELVIEPGAIDSLNATFTIVEAATLVAFAAGVVET